MREPIPKAELEKYMEEIKPLKAGFDLVQDHVVITDENGNILYANKAMERNTGFSVDEVMGRNPGDLWGGKMPREFYERMWDTVKNEKKPFVGEVRNVRKDGTEYWQALHISPVLDEKGEAKFMIGIEPNITDRKEKEQFREEFLSAVSSQLEDPLAAIHWTLQWLSEHGKITEEQKKLLGELYRDNSTLAYLVSDLLFLAGKSKEKKG